MTNYKIYKSDTAGKAEFVREVISPLLINADTGWYIDIEKEDIWALYQIAKEQ